METLIETFLKFGEHLTVNADVNPEPSFRDEEGVETLREIPKFISEHGKEKVQTTNSKMVVKTIVGK